MKNKDNKDSQVKTLFQRFPNVAQRFDFDIRNQIMVEHQDEIVSLVATGLSTCGKGIVYIDCSSSVKLEMGESGIFVNWLDGIFIEWRDLNRWIELRKLIETTYQANAEMEESVLILSDIIERIENLDSEKYFLSGFQSIGLSNSLLISQHPFVWSFESKFEASTITKL